MMATGAQAQTQAGGTLFKLPPELRLVVYEHLIKPTEATLRAVSSGSRLIVCHSKKKEVVEVAKMKEQEDKKKKKKNGGDNTAMAILTTCKAIHNEAKPLLDARTEFHIIISRQQTTKNRKAIENAKPSIDISDARKVTLHIRNLDAMISKEDRQAISQVVGKVNHAPHLQEIHITICKLLSGFDFLMYALDSLECKGFITTALLYSFENEEQVKRQDLEEPEHIDLSEYFAKVAKIGAVDKTVQEHEAHLVFLRERCASILFNLSSAPTQNQTGHGILKLPPELRLRIYEHLFPCSEMFRLGYDPKNDRLISIEKRKRMPIEKRKQSASILAVCKLIYTEAKPVLYAATTFWIDSIHLIHGVDYSAYPPVRIDDARKVLIRILWARRPTDPNPNYQKLRKIVKHINQVPNLHEIHIELCALRSGEEFSIAMDILKGLWSGANITATFTGSAIEQNLHSPDNLLDYFRMLKRIGGVDKTQERYASMLASIRQRINRINNQREAGEEVRKPRSALFSKEKRIVERTLKALAEGAAAISQEQ
ncbi:hypothetical protein Q7P37_003712 [Cladosporium fusiforme]